MLNVRCSDMSLQAHCVSGRFSELLHLEDVLVKSTGRTGHVR